jgi:hypothetical protein
MRISDDMRIMDVQHQFNEKFPYLKIEFYSEHHEAGQPSSLSKQLNPSAEIGSIRTVHNTEDISINGNLKVKSLEQMFYDKLGLNIQVFRQSKSNIWLQTTATDEWTLSEQNQKAEQYLR